MKAFLDANFRTEGFIPTPYGADSRFQPKSIWVFHEKIQDSVDKDKVRQAWIIASDGNAVFSSDLVKTHSSSIDTQSWNLDKKTELALTAALTGNVKGVDLEAGLEAASNSNSDIQIDFGDVEIEYCYYFDLLTAQELNGRIFLRLNESLKRRFGENIPARRVISAALRIKNASIKVTKGDDAKFSIGSKIGEFFQKLGLTWNRKKDGFNTLEISDWRYIAYQSIITDHEGLISTGEHVVIEETPKSTLPPEEDYAWEAALDRGK